MRFTHYRDLEPPASDFKLSSLDLEVRRQARAHDVELGDLPQVLELLAARQRERLKRSDQRLRERGDGLAVATVPAESAA